MAERQSRRNSQRLEDSPQEHSRLHSRVRSMLGGSSIYSMSPSPSDRGTPKIPTLGLFRRPNDNSVPQRTEVEVIDPPRQSTSSRSPLRRQYTTGSYSRGMGNEHHDSPRVPDRSYSAPAVFRDSMTRDGLDPETNLLADAARRQRRRTRRRKPAYGWLRKKSERGMCCTFATSPPARNRIICAVISGMFLGTILTIYLSICFTRPHIGQEVHVLFILVILATTIFFCHSLITLCILALRPPADTPRIPSMTGPEGFKPAVPIPVILARDEEIVVGDEPRGLDHEETGGRNVLQAEPKLKEPPPAYGLWRCSVRVDPNLIHWQRVDAATTASSSRAQSPRPHASRNGSTVELDTNQTAQEGPRPPSYVSEDGVTYVVAAEPRSIAPTHPPANAPTPAQGLGVEAVSSGMSDVHPAWRP